MKYKHLTLTQLSKIGKVGEFTVWFIFSVMVAFWWLPAQYEEQQAISKIEALIYFFCLWVYFLNPITHFGFKRLNNGYKYFIVGKGSYVPLKLRFLIMMFATSGFIYGLYISA